MVCRSTPGNSGITSLARHNSGLLDVQVLSMFHEVRASQPRDTPAPSTNEIYQFLDGAASRVRTATDLSPRERSSITRRIREASTVPPDGRTYYAWRTIEEATARGRVAMDTHFRTIADQHGHTVAEVQSAFETMMRREHRIDGEVPRPPSQVDYFTENTPRDRGTRHALAMLYTAGPEVVRSPRALSSAYAAAEARSQSLAHGAAVDPAQHCPDCGQFADANHTCPTPEVSDFHAAATAYNDSQVVEATAQAAVDLESLHNPVRLPDSADVVAAAEELITEDRDFFTTSDGTQFRYRAHAISYETNHIRNEALHARIEAAVAAGAPFFDPATARDQLERAGFDEYCTSDGFAFSNEQDAVWHEFQTQSGYSRCEDCGRYANLDHTCASTPAPAPATTSPAPAPVSAPVETNTYDFHYVELPTRARSQRIAMQDLTSDGTHWFAADGTRYERMSDALRYDRERVEDRELNYYMGQAVERGLRPLDTATLNGGLDRAGDMYVTSDGQAFEREHDAVWHEFHVNNGYSRCEGCGQFANLDHSCPNAAPTTDTTPVTALGTDGYTLTGLNSQAPTVTSDDESNAERLHAMRAAEAEVEAEANREHATRERLTAEATARAFAGDELAAWEVELLEGDAARASADEAQSAVQAPTREPAGAPVRRRNPLRTYRAEDGSSVRLMNLSAVRSDLRDNPAEPLTLTDVQVTLPDGEDVYVVSGNVDVTDTGLRRTNRRDRYTTATTGGANTRGLRCTCPDYRETYDCEHVRQAMENVQALLNQRDAVAIAPAVAMESVGADLRGEYDASLSAAQQARDGFATGTDGVSYVEDMSAFQSAWDEAKAHFASGDHRLPYMIENATNGLGVRGPGGRSIGIEIEVDFPDDTSFTAKERVAREIYEAGLSDSDQVRPWHWRARQTGARGQAMGGGYTDNPNMWSVEFDRSVDDVGGNRGCEIVSPILYDTPETWNNLKKICEIVESHGGKVTPRTGLHINVGAADFDHTVANHNTLVGLANAYEDVIVRSAHNPASGSQHRGREYCRPMDVPAAGYSSIRAAQRNLDPRSDNGSSHRAMINLDHVPAEGAPVQSSTRVEVRIFDGSLDPGRIQANAKLSLGLVDASVRGVEVPTEVERAGTHRTRNVTSNGRARRLRGEEWANDMRSARQLADTLFTRDEDKKQFVYTMCASRWQVR